MGESHIEFSIVGRVRTRAIWLSYNNNNNNELFKKSISELFNKSISEGYFPKSFRIGEITPILKKHLLIHRLLQITDLFQTIISVKAPRTDYQ